MIGTIGMDGWTAHPWGAKHTCQSIKIGLFRGGFITSKLQLNGPVVQWRLLNFSRVYITGTDCYHLSTLPIYLYVKKKEKKNGLKLRYLPY